MYCTTDGGIFIVPVDQQHPIARTEEAIRASKELHWRVHTLVVQLVEDISAAEPLMR